ncbi:MAG: hypothetical protein FWG57_05895 [Endomicrobia bacterium]|nr:hypothetical protein [Endomicrobiia bacterium]
MKFFKALLVLSGIFCFYSFAAAQPADKYLMSVLAAAEKHNNTMTFEKPEKFSVHNTGIEKWVDYDKYGEFSGLGTENYKYIVKDLEGLQAASGAGIYPNTQDILNEPDYKDFSKKLGGNKWKFLNNDNFQLNFFKWGTSSDDPGLNLYYTAFILERSGNFHHAVKAYYACLVFFPNAVGYTQWGTPWYVAPACVARLKYLAREHGLGVKLADESIIIKNSFDNDTKNDVFIINPGKLVPAEASDFNRKIMDLSKSGEKKVTGKGKVKLTQYNNHHFRLTVDDKPYVVRGISYSPSKVGLTPDFGTLNNLRDWAFDDYNRNGRVDGPYDSWVDVNRNDKKDEYAKSVGDFALMKEMGINTIRLYHYADLNKTLLREGYEKYGFMYMMGNLIGMYAVDSGAGWFEGTDYTDKEHVKNMLASVRRMVEEYKDEPYILMWVLGNENNYGSIGDYSGTVGSACLAPTQPDAYYGFVNECAKLIKSLDPQKRPVAICNGDLYLLDYCAKNAPDVDIYGANAYRGDAGFGLLWKDVLRQYEKPVLITEYGCPAYAKGWSKARSEDGQAGYHKGNWDDIEDNLGGIEGGIGNALGGVIFEWTDEWWKAGPSTDPSYHDTESQWGGPFLDGKAYEEWFGICSQGNGSDSPFKRQLRKVYFTYRDLWEKYR